MKSLINVVACLSAMWVAVPASASPALFVALPDLSALTCEASSWVGDEMRALQRSVTALPRLLGADRTLSVAISEGANHMIVVASRLPATIKPSVRH